MSYNILSTSAFDRKLKRLAKRYSSLKTDLLKITNELYSNPELGVSLGNGCYKIRLAITSKSKGKSGGARLITLVIRKQNTIYLLDIYDKSEQENITEQKLKFLIDSILE